MEGIVGFKLVIQPLVTALSALLAFSYPWTAVPAYLLLFFLPYEMTRGSAPLAYPVYALGVPLLLRVFLTSGSGAKRSKTFLPLVICFGLLVLTSQWWGYEKPAPEFSLGIAFLAAAPLICTSDRGFRQLLILLLASLMALTIYFNVSNPWDASRAVFEAVSKDKGDRNYASFLTGIGAIIAWLIVFLGMPGSSRWVGIGWRLVALLCFALICKTILKFQSRGMALAILAGVAASLLYGRKGATKKALLGMILATIAYTVLSQVPAFELLLKRFGGERVETANGRLDLIRACLNLFSLNPAGWPFGMGYDAITWNIAFSPHNSYVRILVEQGFVGLGLMLTVLAASAMSAWRRKDTIGQVRWSLLAFAGVAAMSIEPHLYTPFWLVLALAAPTMIGAQTSQGVKQWMVEEERTPQWA